MPIYIKIDENNIIWDAITYPYEDYIMVNAELPLPPGLIGGWYRFENGAFVYDEERYLLLNPVIEEPEQPAI